MIEIKHLSKTFQMKDGAVNALKDISLTIPDGSIYGIIGMSGGRLEVNHQYDKSSAFLRAAQRYVARSLAPQLQAASALSDLWELQVRHRSRGRPLTASDALTACPPVRLSV